MQEYLHPQGRETAERVRSPIFRTSASPQNQPIPRRGGLVYPGARRSPLTSVKELKFQEYGSKPDLNPISHRVMQNLPDDDLEFLTANLGQWIPPKILIRLEASASASAFAKLSQLMTFLGSFSV
ncbi:hypothetical protein PABG_01685 [Paracoccidioides brasiliensis Pb03]|nr:hypothetical protein PABG_01685 [Paracoccidioides brasiliensis Pb03]